MEDVGQDEAVDTGGDEAVLSSLYREHYRPLVRLAMVLTSDPELAEDLVQEAFLRTWRRGLRDVGSAPAYLRVTVVNLVRRSWRRRLLAARERFAAAPVADERDASDRLHVLHGVRRLPVRQRTCVALRYFEGLSEQETADVMGTTVGTVASQTHKALRRLEQLLGGDAE